MSNKIKIGILSGLLLVIIVSGVLLLKHKDNKKEENITSANPTPVIQSQTSPTKTESQEPEKSSKLDTISLSTGKFYEENYAELDMTNGIENYISIFNDKIYYIEETKILQLDTKEIYLELDSHYNYSNSVCFSIDQQGTIWLLLYENEEFYILGFEPNTTKPKKKIMLSEFTQRIQNDNYMNPLSSVSKIQIDEKYIYIQYRLSSNFLLIFDHSGNLVREIENCSDFWIEQESVFLLTDNTLSRLKVEEEHPLWEKIIMGNRLVYYSTTLDQIFVLTKNGIEIYDKKGLSEPKTLIQFGVDTSYTMDNSFTLSDGRQVVNLIVTSDASIYIGVKEIKVISEELYLVEQVLTLYRYQWKEDEPFDEYTYTITAPYKDPFLVQAIRAYETRHPDIHIQLDYTYETREEYLEHFLDYGQAFSLRIMTGDIGDIVMWGGQIFPYSSICKTDAFLDLRQRVKELEIYEDLNQNVLENMEINQQLYALPISMWYDYIWVDEEVAERNGIDLETLTYAKAIELSVQWRKEGRADRIFDDNTGFILGKLFSTNLPQLVDLETRSIHLRQDWFLKALEQYKELLHARYFSNSKNDGPYLMGNRIIKAVSGYRDRSVKMSYVQEIEGLLKRFNEESQINQNYHPDLSGEYARNIRAYPAEVYLISSRSSHIEEAWDFLSFLLDPIMQKNSDLKGVAVNIKAEKELFEAQYRGYNNTINEEGWKILEKVYEAVDFSYWEPYLIIDMMTPISKWVDDTTGKLTLEDALTEAEQNLSLRLNE